jgi:hypothetical protein
LSAFEIDKLTSLCWDLGSLYPKLFPDKTITPKLHILVFHVPQFAAKWKYVGMFSESGFESIHKNVNAKCRTFCQIRSKPQRASLVFREHFLHSEETELYPGWVWREICKGRVQNL